MTRRTLGLVLLGLLMALVGVYIIYDASREAACRQRGPDAYDFAAGRCKG